MSIRTQRSAGLFNGVVLKAVDDLFKNVGEKGYRANSDFTNDFNFGPYLVKAHNPPFTMCVSFQFELILTAIILYVQAGGDKAAYAYLKKSQWFGLNGLTLQNCVWENENCHSVGQALSMFGMGESLAFSQLMPGSFVSYDHGTGGHSVCFLGFLDANGQATAYSAGVAGFRFIASNGSGQSGDGISYRDGVLRGKQMARGQHKQSTGIKNMRGGVMYAPTAWRAPTKAHFNAELATAFAAVSATPPTGQR